MTHLTPVELIDALEGPEPFTPRSRGKDGVDRRAHLDTCEHCQRELAGLANVLGEAKQLSVAEPSPLFWQHFSERVRTAIDGDVATGNNWPSWLRRQVLFPLGAAALIILSLMIAAPKQDRSESDFTLQAPEAPEALQAPVDSWTMVAELVGDFNLETAVEAGVVVTPGLAERAALELTADEQQELTRLLRAELTRVKL